MGINAKAIELIIIFSNKKYKQMEQDQLIKNCIKACQQCVVACLKCAQACLKEEKLEMMRKCIQTDLECAEICESTYKLLIMDSKPKLDLVKICLDLWNTVVNVPKHVGLVLKLVGNW